MDPLNWPHAPTLPDPLPEMAHEALREARVTLWSDLWEKVERAEMREKDMDAAIDFAVQCATYKLREQLGQMRGHLDMARRRETNWQRIALRRKQ